MYEHLSILERGVLGQTSLIETHPDREILHKTELIMGQDFQNITLYQYPTTEILKEEWLNKPIYIITKWGNHCKPVFNRRMDFNQALRVYKKLGGLYDENDKYIRLMGDQEEEP